MDPARHDREGGKGRRSPRVALAALPADILVRILCELPEPEDVAAAAAASRVFGWPGGAAADDAVKRVAVVPMNRLPATRGVREAADGQVHLVPAHGPCNSHRPNERPHSTKPRLLSVVEEALRHRAARDGRCLHPPCVSPPAGEVTWTSRLLWEERLVRFAARFPHSLSRASACVEGTLFLTEGAGCRCAACGHTALRASTGDENGPPLRPPELAMGGDGHAPPVRPPELGMRGAMGTSGQRPTSKRGTDGVGGHDAEAKPLLSNAGQDCGMNASVDGLVTTSPAQRLACSGGTILACGDGASGAFGRLQGSSCLVPSPVARSRNPGTSSQAGATRADPDTERCVSVSGGAQHALAVGVSGCAFSFGRWSGRFAKLGQGLRPALLHAATVLAQHQACVSSVDCWAPSGVPREVLEVPTPISVLACVRVVAVAAGREHSLFLSEAGAVYSCGWGLLGRLGHGDEEVRTVPARIDWLWNRGVRARAIAAGAAHSLVAGADGSVFAFGDAAYGKLGLGCHAGHQLLPSRVPLPDDVCGVDDWQPTAVSAARAARGGGVSTAVAAGTHHSLVATASGALFAFGAGDYGRLGLASETGTYKPWRVRLAASWEPVQSGDRNVPEDGASTASRGARYVAEYFDAVDDGGTDWGPRVVAVSAGDCHSLALDCLGAVWAFGVGEDGQLGLGDGGNRLAPEQVGGSLAGLRVCSISAGFTHSVVRTEDGSVFAFGDADDGQLGLGCRQRRLVPTRVRISGD